MRHATPRGLRRHVWPRRSGTPRTASTGRRGRRPPVSPRERGPAGGSSRDPARRDHDTPMSGTHRAMASGNLLWGYPTLAQSTPGLCRVADTPANVRPRGPHTSEPKPIKVLPDGAVTLARCTLERGAIQNRHVDTNAPRVASGIGRSVSRSGGIRSPVVRWVPGRAWGDSTSGCTGCIQSTPRQRSSTGPLAPPPHRKGTGTWTHDSRARGDPL
jgi:hypothetical protein